MGLQKAIEALFPTQCLTCPTIVAETGALCPSCWADTPFLGGLLCAQCAVPLLGEAAGGDALCDTCLAAPRPWAQGRAVFEYAGNGRKIVLALKYGHRMDISRHVAPWLARQAGPLITDNTIIVPIPLHWQRLLRRRFNQSALLAGHLGQALHRPVAPDALIRARKTGSQDGRTAEGRFRNLDGAIAPHRRNGASLDAKDVLLIDDVMTSGATFAAAATAAWAAGAARIDVITLARVVKAV
ncbi:MAG: double zinc ribbon domain-containing protein [Pseudomonadota bacterium]